MAAASLRVVLFGSSVLVRSSFLPYAETRASGLLHTSPTALSPIPTMHVIETISEDIPKDENFDILTSSFFQNHKELPTPEEVRARARAQYAAGTYWGWKERSVNSKGYNGSPVPAVFEEMGLFVKWGSLVKLTEGQTLYAIRNHCGRLIPVPELYGWRTDGSEVFLYMEAVYGRTMEDAWPDLDEEDRLHIFRGLRSILCNLRQIRLPPAKKFIGKISKIVLLLLYY